MRRYLRSYYNLKNVIKWNSFGNWGIMYHQLLMSETFNVAYRKAIPKIYFQKVLLWHPAS